MTHRIGPAAGLALGAILGVSTLAAAAAPLPDSAIVDAPAPAPVAAGTHATPAGAASVAAAAAVPAPDSTSTFARQAEAGNAEAQVRLGLQLIKSTDPADRAQAVAWFRKAAAQGNTDGEWNLGVAYLGGVGIARDQTTGFAWMRKSLADGSGAHMLMYATAAGALGGMPMSHYADWMRKSAAAGFPPAMLMLAQLDQKKAPAAARKWLQKAAAAGDAKAQTVLGEALVHGGPPFAQADPATGLRWLREASAQGFAPAQGQLAMALLMDGQRGVTPQPAEGVRWAKQAAAQGVPSGHVALGYAYDLGMGEPRDPAQAWYQLAVAQRLDTHHEFPAIPQTMSQIATGLSRADVRKLAARAARVPLPAANHHYHDGPPWFGLAGDAAGHADANGPVAPLPGALSSPGRAGEPR